jgi:hypothetical protein
MATINGHDFYGGATVMRLSDANGVAWMSCCTTRHSDNLFAFRIFKGADLIEVPLSPICTGRGSMNLAGWWVAANGKEWFGGQIPGFAPHPIGGHDARVDALLATIAALGKRIDALETSLSTAGNLDPADRTAIDRLRDFLRMG